MGVNRPLAYTWQPLGPLLKVKLLVGYISVKECTGGTAHRRQNDVLRVQL